MNRPGPFLRHEGQGDAIVTPDSSSRDSLEAGIVVRALHDGAFRQRLIADPRLALREQAGVDLPASVRMVVLEETPSQYYLVLPAADDGEATLTDSELEGVAGGKSPRTATTSEPPLA